MIRATMTATLLVLALAEQFAAGLFLPGPTGAPAIAAADVGAPAKEPLLRFAFDPPQWGMPDGTAWTHMDISIIEIDPGRSFDTHQGWYTSTDGPLLLYILDGELTVNPKGPSFFYPANAPDQPPVENGGGQTIALAPGEGIVYSIQDTATATNPGTETMRALIGLAGGSGPEVAGALTMPSDVQNASFDWVDGMPVLPTRRATVSIQRLRLAPYDTYVIDPAALSRYLPAIDVRNVNDLYMTSGAMDTLSPGTETQRVFGLAALPLSVAKPYTLINLGEEPIDIYFFVVQPAPIAGTPAL